MIYMIEINKVYNMDCLEGMKLIDDNSIDMILCDLPYGMTSCNWDTIIPFNELWLNYKRIIKEGGAIVLTGREPFTSKLIISNINNYKHKWIWNKGQAGSFMNAKYMPLQIEEDILVFSYGKCNYYPKMILGKYRKKGGTKKDIEIFNGLNKSKYKENNYYYPTNIIEITNNRINKFHPTEKPVELFKYLIENYTKSNNLVLDNCIGSGTTAIACKELQRNFIGFEISKEYCDIANQRLEKWKGQQRLIL